MGIIIEESGMKFGEYEENQVFQIETSEQYTKSLRQNGIKSCEFILQRGKKLFFIEAKSSCPRHVRENMTDTDRQEKQGKYQAFIQEIVAKMKHSLTLYGNILLQRYTQENLPEEMSDTNLSNVQIYLILVIKLKNGNWKPEPELQDDLRNCLRDELRIWKIRYLVVMNEETARKKNFII